MLPATLRTIVLPIAATRPSRRCKQLRTALQRRGLLVTISLCTMARNGLMKREIWRFRARLVNLFMAMTQKGCLGRVQWQSLTSKSGSQDIGLGVFSPPRWHHCLVRHMRWRFSVVEVNGIVNKADLAWINRSPCTGRADDDIMALYKHKYVHVRRLCGGETERPAGIGATG